jgi:hypothetical protein
MQLSYADVNSLFKKKCWTNSWGPLVNSLLWVGPLSTIKAFSESRRCCAAETYPAAEWSREDAITAYIISQAIRGGEKYRSLSDSQWPVRKEKV